MSDSYALQAEEEIWAGVVARDSVPTTYLVRDGALVLQDGFLSLGSAQSWRDRWERRNRGRAAVAESVRS